MLVSQHTLYSDNGLVAIFEDDGIVFYLTNANFWSLQILQDGDRLVKSRRHMADPIDQRPIELVIAMGKIKPGNVHAGMDEGLNGFVFIGARPQCTNNLNFPTHHFLRQFGWTVVALPRPTPFMKAITPFFC